jgi:hypothetical protein
MDGLVNKSSILLLVALLSVRPARPSAPVTGVDGDYSGRGILQMTITTPAYRQLPPEETNSLVIVRSAGGGRVLVNVRFNQNGNQCSLNGSQVGDGFAVDPGQICRGLMGYGAYDIDAVMRVTDGRATVSGGLLTFQLQGDVDAEHRDGSHNTGAARWSLQATR